MLYVCIMFVEGAVRMLYPANSSHATHLQIVSSCIRGGISYF